LTGNIKKSKIIRGKMERTKLSFKEKIVLGFVLSLWWMGTIGSTVVVGVLMEINPIYGIIFVAVLSTIALIYSIYSIKEVKE
jgi:hypothetical protein